MLKHSPSDPGLTGSRKAAIVTVTPLGCAMPCKEDGLSVAIVLRHISPYQVEAATAKVVNSMMEGDTRNRGPGMTVTHLRFRIAML